MVLKVCTYICHDMTVTSQIGIDHDMVFDPFYRAACLSTERQIGGVNLATQRPQAIVVSFVCLVDGCCELEISLRKTQKSLGVAGARSYRGCRSVEYMYPRVNACDVREPKRVRLCDDATK